MSLNLESLRKRPFPAIQGEDVVVARTDVIAFAAVEIQSHTHAIERSVDAFGAHLAGDVQCLAAKPNPPADGVNPNCLPHSVRDIVLALVFGPQFTGLGGVNDCSIRV